MKWNRVEAVHEGPVGGARCENPGPVDEKLGVGLGADEGEGVEEGPFPVLLLAGPEGGHRVAEDAAAVRGKQTEQFQLQIDKVIIYLNDSSFYYLVKLFIFFNYLIFIILKFLMIVICLVNYLSVFE